MTHGKERKKRSQHSYYRCHAKHEQSYAHKCDIPSFRLKDVDTAVWSKIAEWLEDSTQLEAGFADYRERREKELAPVRERVETIDQLLDENRDKLQRLVDLYLSAEIDKELLVGRKRQLEETLRALQAERSRQVAVLEAEDLTETQVRDITEFARRVRAGLAKAEESFEAKREVIELLNVEVICFVEGGVKKVRVTAAMGLEDVLSVASTSSS